MLLDNPKFFIKSDEKGLKIRIRNSQKPFYLKEDNYYSEIAQFIEILKVEGYWNEKGNMSIQNKSSELANFFESLIKVIGINCRRSTLIKIKIPHQWTKRENIKVFEGTHVRSFHFGRNGFTNHLDSIVFETRNSNEKFKIKYKDKQILFSLTNGQINTPKIKSYFVLKASNKAFTNFMGNVLKEENSTHKIRINNYLKNSRPKIIAKVFGSVIDCDGSIKYYKLYRAIILQQSSLNYIKDWQTLLKSIGIKSSICKRYKLYQLTITCNQNFKKLHELGFELHHKTKFLRFNKILNTYHKHQFERNTALEYYTALITNNPGKTALELSKIANKNKKTISHFLKILIKSNLISRQLITKQKFIYFPKQNNNKQFKNSSKTKN